MSDLAQINDWFQQMSSPFQYGLKKYLYELMPETYSKNEEMINKLTEVIKSEKDYRLFGQFISDFYQVAYMKSVEDHKEQLEKLGYKIKFTQPEKSG